AGVSVDTLSRIERGKGASLENVVRVVRALGLVDTLVSAIDPYESDLGRLRADEALPDRVRRGR
ncbi:MAG: helix-turn-helix transcriptional regulator, partial [Acidimicrobiia bacterium]|nr:helix-turn-helix transcriptional regulator [Acidimicrobiia bacterium]